MVDDRDLETGVDASSPVPLYYQLKQLLSRRISRGELRPGDQLPTESQLCERYRVSRTPVRQALLEMSREGLITRRAGRGTFVTSAGAPLHTVRALVPDERWQGPLEQAAGRLNETAGVPRLELEIAQAPLAELHDRLLLAVARGLAPDIAVVDTVWVAELAHRRYLLPLDELDAAWAREVRTHFFSPLLAACQHAGALHAVPANADATVLWYRSDWLAAEGLQPPGSWEDLVTLGRHFRRSDVRTRYGSGRHPLSFVGGRAGGETTTYQMLPLLWAAGGDLVADGRVVLDSESARVALRFLRDLVQLEEIASPDVTGSAWDGAFRDLAEGRAVMAFGGTYERALIQAAAGLRPEAFARSIDFVPLPTGPAGNGPPTIVGGMGYAITRQSRNPSLALELLGVALGPELLARLSLATSQNATHLGVAEALRPSPDGFLEQAAALFAGARSRPALPEYDRVSAQFQELVERCLTGDEAIPELLRRATERISGITGLAVADADRAA